jgi:Sulfotransferase family
VRVDICDAPIFVLGPPRSGTSMMQWALRQSPMLWGGQESDFLIPLMSSLRDVYRFGSKREKLHWLSGQEVSFDEFARHIGVGINALYTDRSGGKRWVEQTPQYTLHLDDMHRLFPSAQFLFMVRDGREVVHSLRNFVNPVAHEDASRIWVDFIRAGVEFSNGSNGRQLMFVSYHDAVHDTVAELTRVYDFIGEPFTRASVEFITSKAPINSSFDAGDNAAGKTAGWGSWDLSERQTFDDIAGRTLEALGFVEDSAWVSRS